MKTEWRGAQDRHTESLRPCTPSGQLWSFWFHGLGPHPGDHSSGPLSFIPLAVLILGDESFTCPGLVLCTLLSKRLCVPQSHAPRIHQIFLVTNSYTSSTIPVSCGSLTNHHPQYVQLINRCTWTTKLPLFLTSDVFTGFLTKLKFCSLPPYLFSCIYPLAPLPLSWLLTNLKLCLSFHAPSSSAPILVPSKLKV